MFGLDKKIFFILIWITFPVLYLACNRSVSVKLNHDMHNDRINKSDSEWKELLSAEQYNVLRQKATEPPFSGKYWNQNANGIYCCAACGSELFSSENKFDAGCGWPSFFDAIAEGKIEPRPDTSYNMVRTEILCAKCGGHLGHLFDDGPAPTGKRYCVNSASLDFKAKK